MTNYKFRCEEPTYRGPLPKEDDDFDFKERQVENNRKLYNPPIAANPETLEKTTTSKLRVRKTPNGEVVKVLDAGTTVQILEERGDGWTKLEGGYFVMSRFLK